VLTPRDDFANYLRFTIYDSLLLRLPGRSSNSKSEIRIPKFFSDPVHCIKEIFALRVDSHTKLFTFAP
jgi:hypothetical protein